MVSFLAIPYDISIQSLSSRSLMLDWWSRVFGRWNFTENRRETMPKGRQDQVGGDGGLSILKNKKILSCYIRHQQSKKKKGKNGERWRRNELRYLPQTDNIQLIQPIKLWRLPPPLKILQQSTPACSPLQAQGGRLFQPISLFRHALHHQRERERERERKLGAHFSTEHNARPLIVENSV